MSLTLPNGRVKFMAGTKSLFDGSSKSANVLYLVDDNDKFYLYAGENQIFSPVDVVDQVVGNSLLPVTSKAVYEYFNADANKVLIYGGEEPSPQITAGMIAGRFYYFDDGTIQFYRAMGEQPITLQHKLTIDSTYSPSGTNPISGEGVAQALNTRIQVVDELPEKGTEGIDKKLWCLVTAQDDDAPDKSAFYYFPTKDSEAIKLGSGEGGSADGAFTTIIVDEESISAEDNASITFKGESGISIEANPLTGEITFGLDATGGFVLLDPSTESQTIQKDLLLTGDLSLKEDKKIVVDNIESNKPNPLNIKSNTVVSGNTTTDSLTVQQDAQVQGNLTVSKTTDTLDLVVNGTITNSKIFSTAQATLDGAAANIKLETGTELYFGYNNYLKPAEVRLPVTIVDGSLTAGQSVSQHSFNGQSFTFENGVIYITNNNDVSTLNNSTTSAPLVIGSDTIWQKHLEVAYGGIQSYGAGLAAGGLQLNPHGGRVEIGPDGLTINGSLSAPDATFDDLTVNTSTTLVGTVTLREGNLNTKWFSGVYTDEPPKLNMASAIYFGGIYNISASGVANLDSLSITNSTTLSGDTTIVRDITFKEKTLSTIVEGTGDNQSGSSVFDGLRLMYDGQQLLTKADISSGPLKGALDGIEGSVTANKKIMDELIVIGPHTGSNQPPEQVTNNTILWIDTYTEESGDWKGNSGIICIKKEGQWVPVTSVWS